MIDINTIIGKKYNSLTVLKEAEPYINKKTGIKSRKVGCLCDCGNKTDTGLSNLLAGKVKSCGCAGKNIAHETHNPKTKEVLRRREMKKLLQDFNFYTNLFLNSGIFSSEKRVAKSKLNELIVSSDLLLYKKYYGNKQRKNETGCCTHPKKKVK